MKFQIIDSLRFLPARITGLLYTGHKSTGHVSISIVNVHGRIV